MVHYTALEIYYALGGASTKPDPATRDSPAIPKSTTAINIVEMEKPGTYFNFYNVSVISKPINVNKELCAN
jgi:hypothetical protein